MTAKLNSELVSKNELKIAYEVFEEQYVNNPVVKGWFRSKLSKFMELVTTYSFGDLFSGTKSAIAAMGRNVIAPLVRSAIQLAVRANITYSQTQRLDKVLGNVKAPNALVERLNIIAKTTGSQVARVLSTASNGGKKSGSVKAIQRMPLLTVLGPAMEIYGAFATASVNGAYESSPAILNF
jgi:hypothetical protein